MISANRFAEEANFSSYLLQFVRTKLLVDNLPHNLVGRHGETIVEGSAEEIVGIVDERRGRFKKKLRVEIRLPQEEANQI